MTGYSFTTPEAQTLWDRSSPKGDKHKAAFAWRESPAGVDRAVNKIVRPMKDEQVKIWLADCLVSADIQSRYRGEQQKAGERLCRPKGLAVWLNDGGWGEDVGSTSELKQKQSGSKCKCGKPVAHAKTGECWTCYEKTHPNPMKSELREKCQEGGYHKMTPEENLKEVRKLIGRIG